MRCSSRKRKRKTAGWYCCKSSKVPCPTLRMVIGNCKGGGVSKAKIFKRKYSRTPVIRTRITRTPPANSNFVPHPLDLTPLFSHFYSVNLNSENSNIPLTRTKFRFPWSKFTPITRILVLATHYGCPLKYPINCSCRAIGFKHQN